MHLSHGNFKSYRTKEKCRSLESVRKSSNIYHIEAATKTSIPPQKTEIDNGCVLLSGIASPFAFRSLSHSAFNQSFNDMNILFYGHRVINNINRFLEKTVGNCGVLYKNFFNIRLHWPRLPTKTTSFNQRLILTKN